MNYFTYINQFWALHEEHAFTTTDIALYFYLLKVANTGTFKHQFKRNNNKIEADLDVSYPTLCKSRNRLKQAKLIDFKTRNGDANVEYFLRTVNDTLKNSLKVTDEVNSEVSDEVATEVSDEIILDKDKDKNKKVSTKKFSGKSSPDKTPISGPALVQDEFKSDEEKDFWLRFQAWREKNGINRVQKMEEPFTPTQFHTLCSKYGLEPTLEVIRSMDNWKKLLKDKVSAYKTAITWLNKTAA